MNIPTLAKATNLKEEDVNFTRLYTGYIVLIVGCVLSFFFGWGYMLLTFIAFCIIMISAVDWSP